MAKNKNVIAVKRILRILLEEDGKGLDAGEIANRLVDDEYKYTPIKNTVSQIMKRHGHKQFKKISLTDNTKNLVWVIREDYEIPEDLINPDYKYFNSRWYCKHCDYDTNVKKYMLRHAESKVACENFRKKQEAKLNAK